MSSPVVWDEYVVLTSATSSPQARFLLLGYDRDSGRLLWRTSVGQVKEAGRHGRVGPAAATPVTDGRHIYAYFENCGLFCFDFEGEPVWHLDLGPVEHPWGHLSSPVLWRDRVMQLIDHQGESFVVAVSKQTGRQLWRTGRRSFGNWSTPVVVESASSEDRAALIVNGSGSDEAGGGWVTAYDVLSGRRLWQVQGTTDAVWPSLIVGSDQLFSTSGRNGPVLAIGRNDAVSAGNRQIVWRHSRGGAFVPTGLFYRDRLYLLRDGGHLTCIRPADGNTVWEERLDGHFLASLVAGDGKIYATSTDGAVYVVAAADRFELLSVNHVHAQTVATPALANGEFFLRTETELFCIFAESSATKMARAEALPSHPPDQEQGVASPSDLPAEPAEADSQADQPNLAEMAGRG